MAFTEVSILGRVPLALAHCPIHAPGGAAAGGRGRECIHRGGGLYRGRSGQKKTALVKTGAVG